MKGGGQSDRSVLGFGISGAGWLLGLALLSQLFVMEDRLALLTAWPIVAAVAGAGLVVWACQRLNDLAENHRRMSVVFLVFTSLTVMGYGLFWGLDARYGPIDDHEMIQAMGSDKKMTLSEWPEQMSRTEVAHFGESLRYRPVYYGVKFVETAAWGKKAWRWYLLRMVLAATAMAMLWLVLWPHVGFGLAGLAAMVGMTVEGVHDIFCRLGPSEAYAVPALAIALYAFQRWQNRPLGEARGAAATLAIALVIAVGSKENVVPLAGLALLPWGWRLWREGAGVRAWIGPAAVVASCLVVGLTLIGGLRASSGLDVYGAGVDGTSIATKLVSSLQQFLLSPWVILSFGLAFVLGMWREKDQEGDLPWRLLFLLWGGLTLAWMTQAIFYRSLPEWPSGTRYDLPGLWFPLGGFILSLGLLRRWAGDRLTHVASGAVVVLSVLAAMQLPELHERSRINRDMTRQYASWVGKISRAAKDDPERAVVFYPGYLVNDIEILIATKDHLRYSGVENPVAYSLDLLQPAAPGDSFEEGLRRDMLEMMRADEIRPAREDEERIRVPVSRPLDEVEMDLPFFRDGQVW